MPPKQVQKHFMEEHQSRPEAVLLENGDDGWEDAYPMIVSRVKNLLSRKTSGSEKAGQALQKGGEKRDEPVSGKEAPNSGNGIDTSAPMGGPRSHGADTKPFRAQRRDADVGTKSTRYVAGHRDPAEKAHMVGVVFPQTDKEEQVFCQGIDDTIDRFIGEHGAGKEAEYAGLLSQKSRVASHFKIENSATVEILKSGLSSTEESLIRNSFTGDNLCVKTKTGYEKSFLYLLPVLNKVNEGENALQAIILLQNKQAALNILKMAQKLAEGTNIRIIASCGGTNIYEDIVEIQEGLQVLITTPGRFLDIAHRNTMHFSSRLHLVLDEADVLIHAEKYGILTKIFDLVPKRQVIIFSFKFNLNLRTFAEQKLDKYKFYNLLYETPKLKHYYVCAEMQHKFYCLRALLDRIKLERFIIYCNSAKTVKTLASKLGRKAMQFHSGMPLQSKGEVAEGVSDDIKYVVCNDIYPHNCELKNVKCVINFDSPSFPDQYFNRLVKIGKIDCVVTILTESEICMKDEIEKRIIDKVFPLTDLSLQGLASR